MKLYVIVGSPNSRKVEAVVNHLGLDVERVYLDFFTGDLRQPSYLALNANGMVPTLVDGAFALSESTARSRSRNRRQSCNTSRTRAPRRAARTRCSRAPPR